jgi:uncharacterized protein (DUF433 family)
MNFILEHKCLFAKYNDFWVYIYYCLYFCPHKIVNLKELVESRIVIDAEICHGKPRIKGTRVTVADILLALAEGMSNTDILRNFRSIQGQDIQAAIAYSYCISDNVKLKLKSSFGDQKIIDGSSQNSLVLDSDLQEGYTPQEIERQRFSAALEEQALIQEDITREKVAQIKAKKAQKATTPTVPKREPPKERPYDLLIDISAEPLTKIFSDSDGLEQGLDMSFDNYIFQARQDSKPWLTYSIKAGIEIDPAMKRNLLVTYKGLDGKINQAVFEGYLSTDRQHKVFLQKTPDGDTCGRAL